MDVATEMPVKLPPAGRRPRKVQPGTKTRPSRSVRTRLITLDHLDRRTYASRRALELISALENERGGPDQVTEGVRQLCQRTAILAAILEDFETRWVNGETIDLPNYLSAVGVQRRVLTSLGLHRLPKDVTQSASLGEYLAGKAEETDDGDQDR
jgi:hypothetical protein